MKIALIGPVYPFRGGIAHYTTMLSRAMRTAGHDLLLVSFRRQYPAWIFPGRSDKDPSSSPLQAENVNYWIDSLNPLTWLGAFFRIRAAQPDLLVLQWWSTFWAPVWITFMGLNRLFLRRPTLIICHNVLPHEPHRGDVWLTKLTLRLATTLIVQSDEEQARLLSLAPSAMNTVVPHPVYNMFAEEAIDQDSARTKLGIPPDAYLLLFFGIVRPYKGLRELLGALSIVRRHIQNVQLMIAGEFWEDKSDYLDLIDQLMLEDIVHIDDRYVPNEEVALYFSAANALAAPYRLKTGSGVAQLARGFHLPVIEAPASADASSAPDRPAKLLRQDQIADAILESFQWSNKRQSDMEPADHAWEGLVRVVEQAAQA